MAHTDSERGARVRFPPPFVFVGGILLGVAANRFLAPAPVPLGRAISATCGIIVLLIGLGFVASARVQFHRTGQNPIPWKPTPTLIFEGPYRFTRNPMYLGVTLFEVGLGLAVNNLWISAFAIPALMSVHVIAVQPEERYLTATFGEPYKAYLARVRRYL